MPIVSSVIVEDRVQRDGRRSVLERHTDQNGEFQFVDYLAEPNADAAAIMAARVAAIEAALTDREIAANIAEIARFGSLATPTLRHSTVAQNAAVLRAFYQIATQLQAVMIGDYLSTLSDGQLRTAFNLTQAQVTTLRTNKLTPAATLAASIRSTTGQ